MEYDAVVVGSGPNGLAAGILLQQQGLSVLIIEAKEKIGGGLRTEELTLPGYFHDVCSAIHPLALGSPFLKTLPLQDYGLSYITPQIAASHPLTDGSEAILYNSLADTVQLLGNDGKAYLKLTQALVANWDRISPDILGPLSIPKHPVDLARFGLKGLTSATYLSKIFKTEAARALFAGMAAHAIQPLSNIGTSAVAMVLMSQAHVNGWPIPIGGSVKIADAMAGYFKALGGKIETGTYIKSLNQLPAARALLFDVTPQQLLEIAGQKFSALYKWQLRRFRYGMGVFKIDWALDDAIPFTAAGARQAGTVHLGGTMPEIVYSEQQIWRGQHPEKPFVLLAQQSLFDKTRAPLGKHTAWGYCHVPFGSEKDMTEIIEQQVERFAPGFKDRVLARSIMNTRQMESYNPNYIGGDINGGAMDIAQLFTRPVLRHSPYRTSAKSIYICSSSTPPGGGVHGMCGYHAAKRALKDVFGKQL